MITATDIVGVHLAELEKTKRVVAAVDAEDLSRATPCADFDVRSLINHMCMGDAFFSHAARGGRELPDRDRDFIGDHHVAAFDRWADAAAEAFSTPGILERTLHFPDGDVSGDVALTWALLETVVHRWDLAKATGQDPDVEPEVADLLFERLLPLVAPDFRTGPDRPFGPALEVANDASPIDKLLAFVGRRP